MIPIQDVAASVLTDLLFEEPGVGRCLVAPDGSVLRANAEWLRSTGFSLEDVLGADIVDLFPEGRDMALAMHARARAGHRVDVPRHALRIRGRETWWDGSIAPLPMEGGTGLLITARELVRGAAREVPPDTKDATPSREMLASVVSHAQLCIAVVTGRELRFTLVNPAYQAIAPDVPMLGRTYPEVFPEAAESGSRDRFLRVLDAGEVWEVEAWRAPVPGKPDATWRGRVMRLPPVPFEPPSALVVIEDVTAQSRAELALGESEVRAQVRAAELQTVLDTVPAAVWIARDARGDRIDANRFGAELLRRRHGENVSITAPGEDRPRHFLAKRDGRTIPDDELPIQRAARSGEEVRDAAIDVEFDDGEILHLIGNATPLRDEAGRVKGSVGAFIDVTARVEAEARLRDADRRKTEFLALLSHELRNPLAVIRNGLALLDRSAPGSEAAERARDLVRRQSEQLARLVDDLLDISRISYGKIEVVLKPVDAREVARRAHDDARALFDQREVALLLSEPAEPVWVEADAARLAQMLGNLLHNALKFTPPGGQVTLAVSRRAGACALGVKDSGVGLAPPDLERIFDPFVQAAGARPGERGLGLGLAVVRQLAAKHHGTVRALSEGAGRGAEFVIELPAIAAPERSGDRPVARPAGRGLSIVVVEDNEDAATSLADLLALGGHRVRVCGAGRAGVEAVVADRPDVLVCDLGLPDLSGLDVIREVRAATPGAPIFAVALTGYAQPRDREQAIAAGFDAHLPKPPPLEELDRLLVEASQRRAPAHP